MYNLSLEYGLGFWQVSNEIDLNRFPTIFLCSTFVPQYVNGSTLMQNRFATYQAARPVFGRWLLDQASRPDPVGYIAKAATSDPRFPKDGAYEDVLRRLGEAGADGDAHHALEQAEIDYLCL